MVCTLCGAYCAPRTPSVSKHCLRAPPSGAARTAIANAALGLHLKDEHRDGGRGARSTVTLIGFVAHVKRTHDAGEFLPRKAGRLAPFAEDRGGEYSDDGGAANADNCAVQRAADQSIDRATRPPPRRRLTVAPLALAARSAA